MVLLPTPTLPVVFIYEHNGVGTLGSLTVSGAATLSGLSTAGIVTNTAGGVLGTGQQCTGGPMAVPALLPPVPPVAWSTLTVPHTPSAPWVQVVSVWSAAALVHQPGPAVAVPQGVGSYINNATTLQTSANF